MFELIDNGQGAVIKVMGVGGGGGNAVELMVAAQIGGVEFIVANTDVQVLERSGAQKLIQLGASITKGLGAGSDPAVGAQAALEDKDQITEALRGADMLFLTAGMGGGTGTGAAPVIAQIAKELGILTVAVVTRPFGFEMKRRSAVAEQGIAALAKYVDSLIILPNDKLLSELDQRTPLMEAFKLANRVLLGAVQGIAELITRPGDMNLDFADVRSVMSEMGMAMMGSSSAQGEGRARAAAEAAVTSPFLEDIDIAGARGILINITAGPDLTLGEVNEVGTVISEIASPDARVKVGTVLDAQAGDTLRVTVVATGLNFPKTQHLNVPEGAPLKREAPVLVLPRAAATGTGGARDWSELDKPTITRNARRGDPQQPYREQDLEYLEIPAFLRRQAD